MNSLWRGSELFKQYNILGTEKPSAYWQLLNLDIHNKNIYNVSVWIKTKGTEFYLLILKSCILQQHLFKYFYYG